MTITNLSANSPEPYLVVPVETRHQYGQARTYILDPDIAHAVWLLTGAKTLTPQHLQALAVLGIVCEESRS